MTYGLISAIAWGISTIAATNAARRVGIYAAVLLSQGLGVGVLGVLAVFLRPSLSAVGGLTAIGLAGAGVLGAAGWLAYYAALASGPVGLVSAIGAAYGGVTALLAVAVLGEHLGGPGGAGAVLTVAGVTMAAGGAGERAAAATGGAQWPGIRLALASALTYGAGAFLLGTSSARAGWLASALVAYACSVIALLIALPFYGGARRALGRTSGVTWAAAAGLAEAAALLAFSRGGQLGHVAVTAAVSSAYPAIPLAAGFWIFGERLTGRQIAGAALIVGGLVAFSLRGA